ncbi:MAG: cytochrome C [Deltaproteobacteria bacterium]|nr:cytochrome C [Deltaproteobacteria bacterium]
MPLSQHKLDPVTKQSPRSSRGGLGALLISALLVSVLVLLDLPLNAHIVPPEDLHPAAESYRRLNFLLNLRPVPWLEVGRDLKVIDGALAQVVEQKGKVTGLTVPEVNGLDLDSETAWLLEPQESQQAEGREVPGIREQQLLAQRTFEIATRKVSRALVLELETAAASISDHSTALGHLETARQLWAAFEPTLRSTDRAGFQEAGRHWLEMTSALGSPGILGIGATPPKQQEFEHNARRLGEYLNANFGASFQAPSGTLAPLPAHSPTFDRDAALPAILPPGAEINKQLPRPRQILNMSERGVDERQTPLIALGDMAFDSPMIFGEPARALGLSCNSCHNKSITNPKFFLPGLSSREGGLDVSNSFFAPHANNGHFDPVDIPDLRGLRFTAPYGRNGRFESLREFTRNVIVNEFNGAEPDPVLLDGLVAYMMEFDFLPNPALRPDGRLHTGASESTRRGEEIFYRPFEQMADRSCATCHVPSDHFLDRKRHDIGSVVGAAESSRDGAMDTPTLLSSRHTAPYFHDGSLPTLRSVTDWFNERYDLGLSEVDLGDLTAYLEVIGDGVDPYEDTLHTLESELEEFDFFLSAYEFLASRGKSDLIDTTLVTIAFEIRAHKWDVQDARLLPVLDRLAELMDEAYEANHQGESEMVADRIAEYRRLYQENVEVLR